MLQIARILCLVLLPCVLACSSNPSRPRTSVPDLSAVNPACKRYGLIVSPDIEPPRLIKGGPPAVPSVTRSNGYACVHGTVDLSGSFAEVEIVATSDEEFAGAVLRALSRWRFSPATRNGVPVRERIVLVFDYVRKGRIR